MNVLLVYSKLGVNKDDVLILNPGDIHHGISYISSVLKLNGHHTKIAFLSNKYNKKINQSILERTIKEFNPKLIGFTSVSSEYPFISKMAQYVKSIYHECFLILGGTHVSIFPEEKMLEIFDSLCIGEGEYPLLELVDMLESGQKPAKIANLWLKTESGIEKNPPRKMIENLDSLPFQDRELWMNNYVINDESVLSILLGRGCPFKCTYCSNHALSRLAAGKYTRYRSPENIAAEISLLNQQYPFIRTYTLQVETIGVDLNWIRKLSAELTEINSKLPEPLSFAVNLRIIPNLKYEQIFEQLKACNAKEISIGLESGSERIRKNVLNRNYSNQDVILVSNLAKSCGLKIHFYVMLGFPDETPADMKETIELCRYIQPDFIVLSIFYPYPGTDLYKLCIERGCLNNFELSEKERTKAFINYPGLSTKQINRTYILFDLLVYRGHKPIAKLIFSAFIKALRMNKYYETFRSFLDNKYIMRVYRYFMKITRL
ncbi:MAG: hypothetical protein QG635_796 [Bacteroidota bacterium]|nr:hypothetical protein [Bacteroidota bacterium]